MLLPNVSKDSVGIWVAPFVHHGAAWGGSSEQQPPELAVAGDVTEGAARGRDACQFLVLQLHEASSLHTHSEVRPGKKAWGSLFQRTETKASFADR